MDLSGKVALVTGAGRGIGKGCAIELARAGADLIVNDRSDSPDVATTRDQILGLGRTCHVIEANVFTREDCEQLVGKSIRIAGQIDVLVSNPAFGVRCEFLEYDAADFERVIARTLVSGFNIGQLVARHMVQRGGGGKILFISSVQAGLPFAHSVAYGAAKAGLNHMVRTIAVELSTHRINVNAIEPGWIDTPGERQTFSEEIIRREGSLLPWGRLGTPTDIGKAAAFLVSEDADYITGSILSVDGGFRYKDCLSERLIGSRE